jgi:NitT/TauT family transport system permease protein
VIAAPSHHPARRPGLADLAVLALVAGVLALIISFAREFRAPMVAAVPIDLRPSALPRYTMYSFSRGVLALAISYLFALAFGWTAARWRTAERLLLPVLDILQSVPVLGFLPGLVLGLVALFPARNVGLELAAILMIFTAQAWNLALSFYNSLKSIPQELREACRMAGWPEWRQFRQLQLPAAAQGLVWNGMLSMAGGWFFLMINEAFRLGDHDFRLPGVGAYMSVAVEHGDSRATALALVAMAVMIVASDRLLWRPLVVWAQKYRLDDSAGGPAEESWILGVLQRSVLWRLRPPARWRQLRSARKAAVPLRRGIRRARRLLRPRRAVVLVGWLARGTLAVALAAVALGASVGLYRVGRLLVHLPLANWGDLVGAAGLTFLRVMSAVVLSTLWALPVGIWVGTSPRISRALAPVIQLFASFPAPMLFPIVVLVLDWLGVPLGVGAIALMVLAAQWYILFNVISAVEAAPGQLTEATRAFRLPAWQRWRKLYIPIAFPSLVTGWITAAGGAWNAAIVAEYVQQGSAVRTTTGLGSLISLATERANFPLLAGGVLVMSALVVSWNRAVWRPLARLAQTRFGLTQ